MPDTPPTAFPPLAWEQNPATGRLTITHPATGTTLHSTVQTDNVVPDPKDATILYDSNTRYKMDWAASRRGNGREWRFAGDTLNPVLYPTDPRLHIHRMGQGSHRTTFRAFRLGRDTYLASGANAIDFHRWDATLNLFVPAASVMVRPVSSEGAVTPGWPPQAPEFSWGQGLLWRGTGDGHMKAGEYAVIDLPAPLWNEFDPQVTAEGSVEWFGYGSDAGKGRAFLLPISPKAIVTPILCDYPASVLACDRVETVRRDGAEFFAVRRQGDAWEISAHRAGWDAPLWRTPLPWVKGMRRGTETHELPKFAPGEIVGSLAVAGDYVFLAHGQGGGVDVFRRIDGAAVGRMASPALANSTVDDPRGGLHAWKRGSGRGAEYVCSVMDFNGSASALWRVYERDLVAAMEGRRG